MGISNEQKEITITVTHASISAFHHFTNKKCVRCDTNYDLYRNYRI